MEGEVDGSDCDGDQLEKLENALALLQHQVDGIMQRTLPWRFHCRDCLLSFTVPLYAGNYEKDRGKEFEGSYTRVFSIMIITYCTLFGYMSIIGTENAALNAIVPTVGFNISTWSLPYIKDLWISFKNQTGQELASMRRSAGSLHDGDTAEDKAGVV